MQRGVPELGQQPLLWIHCARLRRRDAERAAIKTLHIRDKAAAGQVVIWLAMNKQAELEKKGFLVTYPCPEQACIQRQRSDGTEAPPVMFSYNYGTDASGNVIVYAIAASGPSSYAFERSDDPICNSLIKLIIKHRRELEKDGIRVAISENGEEVTLTPPPTQDEIDEEAAGQAWITLIKENEALLAEKGFVVTYPCPKQFSVRKKRDDGTAAPAVRFAY